MDNTQSNIPSELQPYFNYLNKEVVGLHSKWQDYKELFVHSEERIVLLNKIASIFFLDCQIVFRDDFILTICRLTDPLRTAGKENLTLERLANGLNDNAYQKLAGDLKARFSILQQKSGPFKEWRHRRIAHADVPTALKFHPDPLPGIPKEQIDDMLKSIADYLITFQYYFDKTTTWYFDVSRIGGADRLTRHLDNALKWRDDYFKNKLNLNS